MYNFEYTKDGLQVSLCEIPKDELAELMEQDSVDTAEYLRNRHEEKEECASDRQKAHRDTGMKENDYL